MLNISKKEVEEMKSREADLLNLANETVSSKNIIKTIELIKIR